MNAQGAYHGAQYWTTEELSRAGGCLSVGEELVSSRVERTGVSGGDEL